MVTATFLVCAGLLWIAGAVAIAAGENAKSREGKRNPDAFCVGALYGSAALALAYIAGTLP